MNVPAGVFAETTERMIDEGTPVPFFIRGKLVTGDEVRFRSRDLGVDLTAPALNLDELVYSRAELPPLLDVKLSEIVDFLTETGERLELSRNPYLQESLERVAATNPLPKRVVENLYKSASRFMSRDLLMSSVEANFNPAYLDGWISRTDFAGNRGAVRAFPPRLMHMMAGNSPAGCVSSIAQGALVKAVNLFKMPSSDPFTCVAVLRTMADIDRNHPVVRSMSAVYWRGGDVSVERALYRPQYFDRIVAWGGGDAIRNVIGYIGPGLQLISFDPKTSISMIGREAFVDDATMDAVAESAAADIAVFNQEACLASRFVFVEGERAAIERFCARLVERLGVDRDTASAKAPPMPLEQREEIEVLQMVGGGTKVWGKFDGGGMVVLSDEPVGFHPTGKTANVVHVDSLDEAIRYVNVATQTIGVYPAERKAALRDRVASAGGQRVVRLGSAAKHVLGGPHDAMYPLHRFVHWMSDEDA